MIDPNVSSVHKPQPQVGVNPVPSASQSTSSKVKAVALIALAGAVTLAGVVAIGAGLYAAAFCAVPISFLIAVAATAMLVTSIALTVLIALIVKLKSGNPIAPQSSPASEAPLPTPFPTLIPTPAPIFVPTSIAALPNEEQVKVRDTVNPVQVKPQTSIHMESAAKESAPDEGRVMARAVAAYKRAGVANSDSIAKCNYHLARITVATRSGNLAELRDEIEEAEFLLKRMPECDKNELPVLAMHEYLKTARFVAKWLNEVEVLNSDLRLALKSGELTPIRQAAKSLWDQLNSISIKTFAKKDRKIIMEQDMWIRTINVGLDIAMQAKEHLQKAKNSVEAIPGARSLAEAQDRKNKGMSYLVKAEKVLNDLNEDIKIITDDGEEYILRLTDFKGYVPDLFKQVKTTNTRAAKLYESFEKQSHAGSNLLGKFALSTSYENEEDDSDVEDEDQMVGTVGADSNDRDLDSQSDVASISPVTNSSEDEVHSEDENSESNKKTKASFSASAPNLMSMLSKINKQLTPTQPVSIVPMPGKLDTSGFDSLHAMLQVRVATTKPVTP